MIKPQAMLLISLSGKTVLTCARTHFQHLSIIPQLKETLLGILHTGRLISDQPRAPQPAGPQSISPHLHRHTVTTAAHASYANRPKHDDMHFNLRSKKHHCSQRTPPPGEVAVRLIPTRLGDLLQRPSKVRLVTSPVHPRSRTNTKRTPLFERRSGTKIIMSSRVRRGRRLDEHPTRNSVASLRQEGFTTKAARHGVPRQRNVLVLLWAHLGAAEILEVRPTLALSSHSRLRTLSTMEEHDNVVWVSAAVSAVHAGDGLRTLHNGPSSRLLWHIRIEPPFQEGSLSAKNQWRPHNARLRDALPCLGPIERTPIVIIVNLNSIASPERSDAQAMEPPCHEGVEASFAIPDNVAEQALRPLDVLESSRGAQYIAGYVNIAYYVMSIIALKDYFQSNTFREELRITKVFVLLAPLLSTVQAVLSIIYSYDMVVKADGPSVLLSMSVVCHGFYPHFRADENITVYCCQIYSSLRALNAASNAERPWIHRSALAMAILASNVALGSGLFYVSQMVVRRNYYFLLPNATLAMRGAMAVQAASSVSSETITTLTLCNIMHEHRVDLDDPLNDSIKKFMDAFVAIRLLTLAIVSLFTLAAIIIYFLKPTTHLVVKTPRFAYPVHCTQRSYRTAFFLATTHGTDEPSTRSIGLIIALGLHGMRCFFQNTEGPQTGVEAGSRSAVRGAAGESATHASPTSTNNTAGNFVGGHVTEEARFSSHPSSLHTETGSEFTSDEEGIPMAM
ncbi:hypothetical protein NMY22_g12663 [Coprinellus aureogranulatus]|nr:hypothetical protein NMY22_g12663 [Coprinellus aureogranulatus]